jgi:hypothetical protein
MDKEAIMIQDTEGRYWLQTKGEDGRSRSSYLGIVGPVSHVQTWCTGHRIRFSQVKPSTSQWGQVAAASSTR